MERLLCVSRQTSCILATMMSIVLFCIMQMQRHWLASSQLHTILGGYLGSFLFTSMLTAMGNFESIMFGPRFHTRLFPEVFVCLVTSMLAAAVIHRVCITTCFIFSLIALYQMNKLSKQAYPVSTPAPPVQIKKKK